MRRPRSAASGGGPGAGRLSAWPWLAASVTCTQGWQQKSLVLRELDQAPEGSRLQVSKTVLHSQTGRLHHTTGRQQEADARAPHDKWEAAEAEVDAVAPSAASGGARVSDLAAKLRRNLQGRTAGPASAFPSRHVVRLAERSLPRRQYAIYGVQGAETVGAGFCLCVVVLGTVLSTQNPRKDAQKSWIFVLKAILHRRASPVATEVDIAKRCRVSPQGKVAFLSTWDATVATFSCIVGTGLLAMPYAFSLAGLMAAPVLVFFVCCSTYTAHLMAWALNSQLTAAERQGVRPGMRGWGFLAELAFGRRARRLVDSFLVVELWGYVLSSVVTMAMNLRQVVQDLSMPAAVLASVIAAHALTCLPVPLLTRVNVFSNSIFIICCLMFIATGLMLPSKAPASEISFARPHGIVTAAGILIFSPAGHAFYPALMQSMQEPYKYTACVRRAYLAACVLYLSVATAGYLLFGSAAQPSAVRNIGVDLRLVPIPGLGWMNTVAAAGIIVKMASLQPLLLMPLTSTIEGMLGASALGATWAVAPAILVVTAVIALHFANEMASLLNLIGSIFCMNIAFVVPVLCYWKLTKEPVGWLRRSLFAALVLLGGSFVLLGLVSAVGL